VEHRFSETKANAQKVKLNYKIAVMSGNFNLTPTE
jgi:hypothetical protein